MFSAVCCGVWLELSNQKPIRGVVCILLNTNSMYTERYKEWEGFRRSWHCRKIQKFRFSTMLIFWSLVRNSVVLAVYLLFSVACFLTVHEHSRRIAIGNPLKLSPDFPPLHTVHATFTAHGAPSNSAVQGFKHNLHTSLQH